MGLNNGHIGQPRGFKLGFGEGGGFAPPGNSYANPETTAYINAVQSTKQYGSIVDTMITSMKSYGLWDKLKFGILSPITLNDTLSVVDLKTSTVLSGAELRGLTYTGERPQMTTPLPIGIYMKQTGDYVRTGAIPTSLHTLNNTCFAHGVLDNVTGGTKFYYSSQQSTSAVITGNLRTVGNSSIIDSYSTTANAGRNTLGGGTVTDVSGRWIHNRRSGTDVELYKSGVSIGTAANGGGSLPNVEMYLGAQNNAGTPASYGNHICTYHLELSGLTATERNNLETTMSAYESNLGTLRTLTRNLIWDGNSLSVYENWNTLRAASFYAYNSGKKLYRTRNFSVPGQTTAQINSDYLTQIAPEYSASYTKNILVMWEIRNDIYLGASTATAKTNLNTFITLAKTTGFTVVIICPHLSGYSGNTGRTETQYNLAIDEMVSYAIANTGGADYVVQITNSNLWVARSEYASDAAYNTAVATKIANATYYKDGTHLTSAGYNLVGDMVAVQSLNLIG
jgi:lysophospholipase L1-like esterase